MKYSHLAAFVTLLLANFGEIDQEKAIHLSEDCGGKGLLSAGVSLFGLKASCRDATLPHISVVLLNSVLIVTRVVSRGPSQLRCPRLRTILPMTF